MSAIPTQTKAVGKPSKEKHSKKDASAARKRKRQEEAELKARADAAAAAAAATAATAGQQSTALTLSEPREPLGSYDAFQPAWNLRKQDSFVNDGRVAREVFTTMSLLEGDKKFWEGENMLAAANLGLHANAQSASATLLLQRHCENAVAYCKQKDKEYRDLEGRMETQFLLHEEALKRQQDEYATEKKKQEEAAAAALEQLKEEYEQKVKDAEAGAVRKYKSSRQYTTDILPKLGTYVKKAYKQCLAEVHKKDPLFNIGGMHIKCKHPIQNPAPDYRCPSDDEELPDVKTPPPPVETASSEEEDDETTLMEEGVGGVEGAAVEEVSSKKAGAEVPKA